MLFDKGLEVDKIIGNKLAYEWSKTFGGSNDDSGEHVQQTSDGGYIITGFTGSFGAGNLDVYLIKTDQKGNQTWTKTFGGSKRDMGRSVQQTRDGGYIITGPSESFSEYKACIYLIKIDKKGNQTWSKTFGRDSSSRAVEQTTD